MAYTRFINFYERQPLFSPDFIQVFKMHWIPSHKRIFDGVCTNKPEALSIDVLNLLTLVSIFVLLLAETRCPKNLRPNTF